jgi:hypothetical protein
MLKRAMLSLVGLCFLALASCGAARDNSSGDREPLDQPGAQERMFDNSSKRLAGDFVMSIVKDEYGAGGLNRAAAASYRFFEDGRFEREATVAGRALKEEGSYLISASDELVFYVEKVGGELLGAARVEHYRVDRLSDDLISLRTGADSSIALKRR